MSAVRSLKLLFANLEALDRRVLEYLSRHTDDDLKRIQTREVTKTYLEEIVAKCLVLKEEVLSSIENWTDIVPDADVKTQIGIISTLTLEVRDFQLERQRLIDELEETKGKSKDEINKLKSDKRKVEQQLSETRIKLQKKTISVGPTFSSIMISPSSTSGIVDTRLGLQITPSWANRLCSSCGKGFVDELGLNDKCPDCRNIITFGN